MTDEQRVEQATREGDVMNGPKERQRCAKHPRRWEIYRWWRPVPGEGETQLACLQGGGETEVVRSCADCIAEAEAEEEELTR